MTPLDAQMAAARAATVAYRRKVAGLDRCHTLIERLREMS